MLAFIPYSACRCKFSGRAWPPESVRRTAPQGVFLCPRYGGLCVGHLRVCREPYPRSANPRTVRLPLLGRRDGELPNR
ncbi:hypothetical protein [Pseudomonas phage PAShipCat1]